MPAIPSVPQEIVFLFYLLGLGLEIRIKFEKRVQRVDYDLCEKGASDRKVIKISGKVDRPVLTNQHHSISVTLGNKTIEIKKDSFENIVVHYCGEGPSVRVSVSMDGFQGLQGSDTAATLKLKSTGVTTRRFELVKYGNPALRAHTYATVKVEVTHEAVESSSDGPLRPHTESTFLGDDDKSHAVKPRK
ncbi:MAG: hypothetical protein HYR96_13150 [Deltaproteobacteria bacterium]|nr:hypothetical protein [Deltaproteobacteria bacterium]MBI3295679.1 hypothetical protein [Deltaproteobacteria bacterium]